METYTKQNRIQKEIRGFTDLIIKDKYKLNQLKEKGIIVYNPKRNKLKLSFIGLLVVGCLVTPLTNGFILPLIKWSLK